MFWGGTNRSTLTPGPLELIWSNIVCGIETKAKTAVFIFLIYIDFLAMKACETLAISSFYWGEWILAYPHQNESITCYQQIVCSKYILHTLLAISME